MLFTVEAGVVLLLFNTVLLRIHNDTITPKTCTCGHSCRPAL
jgi:hypothetical protein